MKLALLAPLLVATLFLGLSRDGSAPPAGAGAPAYQMAIDLNADAPGIQATRTIVGADYFTVAIHVTQAQTAYTGYSWSMTSSFVVPPPTGQPTHNVAGTGISNCGPFNTCSGGPPTTFVGWISEIDIFCQYAGTKELSFHTSTRLDLEGGGTVLPDLVEAVVQCAGVPEFPDRMSIRHSSGDPGEYGGGTVLNVPVGGTFNAEVWIDAHAQPYGGYQWEIAYDQLYLTHTGNDAELQTGSFSLCSVPSAIPFSGYVIYGQGAGCLSASGGVQFTGHVTNVDLQCAAPTYSLLTTPVLLVAYSGIEDDLTDPVYGTWILGVGGEGPPTATRHKGPNPLGSGTIAQITVRCVEPALDPDNDGCSNAEETGAEWRMGGKRDPFDGNDFFDVPAPALKASMPNGVRNKAVSLIDVGAVLYFVGTVDDGMPNPNGYDYDTDFNTNSIEDGEEYDRTPSMVAMQPWRSGPPNGAVSLTDVGIALAQVGTNCTAAP